MPQDFTKKNEFARLFISLNFDTDFFNGLQEELMPIHSYAKISPAKDFHLTLKFFGNVKRTEIPEICRKLSSMSFSPFSLEVFGIDMFERREPYVIFAKFKDSIELYSLKSKVDSIFGQDRFIPHVTLMRLKNITQKDSCRDIIKNVNVKNHKIKVAKLYLMESTLTNIGPIYTVIETFNAEK